MVKKCKHDKIIDNVVDRLLSSGRYYDVQTNLEYSITKGYKKNRRVFAGELDIIALTHFYSINDYEIKSNHKTKSMRHARKQLYRFKHVAIEALEQMIDRYNLPKFYEALVQTNKNPKLNLIYLTPQIIMRV